MFSDKDAFDNKHGIMAYNRTDQEKGRATKYLPASEWIVSVGKHPGLIPGKVWVQIQESLERNKSKSFRKPRSNEALLTGLLFCSCGERMYPKMSKRKTADGKVIYTYVCKMKERSQRSVCNSKNANGNTLDMAVVEQIKMLAEDKDTFIAQLEQSRRFYTGNRMDYEQRLDEMRKEKAETEKKINSLVDSLVDMGDSPAKAHVTKRIEQLNEEYQSLEKRIQELEGLTTQHALSDIEFDLMRQLLTVFKDGIDEMTIEQKRAAIRTIVRKVIWDGVNAHVVLFGVQDDEIEYPEIASVASDNTDDEDENEELVAFSDVDYEDDDTEDDRLGKTNPLSASKTHWGGRIANAIQMDAKEELIFWLDDYTLEFSKLAAGYYYETEWGKADEMVEIPHANFHGLEYLGNGRLYIWSRILPMLKHYILKGSGPDTFAEVFPQNDYVGKMIYAESTGRIMERAHNDFLAHWVQTGLLSLLALLLFYVFLGIALAAV